MWGHGHCFGHALEATSDFEIPLGHAVAFGILLANVVARQRGLLSKELQAFIADRLLVPSRVVRSKKEHFNPNAVIEAMKKDKKRTGEGLALIMMRDGYDMLRVNDLSSVEAADALAQVGAILDI